ncbi:hypothetical protein TNCV_4837261 [Trichonephila clavipes]|nr:hypothetical protein TNCV_4837261 [Trichonephila clavipes]
MTYDMRSKAVVGQTGLCSGTDNEIWDRTSITAEVSAGSEDGRLGWLRNLCSKLIQKRTMGFLDQNSRMSPYVSEFISPTPEIGGFRPNDEKHPQTTKFNTKGRIHSLKKHSLDIGQIQTHLSDYRIVKRY